MSVEAILRRHRARPPSAKNKRREFKQWLESSEPGEKYNYWLGDLAKQRCDYYQLHKLAADIWQAYEHGLVNLCQRRHGPNHYTYEAQRCATAR